MEELTDQQEWIKIVEEETARPSRGVSLKIIYIDIANDMIAGVLLSQIVYWNLPGKRHSDYYNSKLRIKHDGEFCLMKTQMDWWDDCRITLNQYIRAIKILKDKNLIYTKITGRGGQKITAIYLNKGVFAKAYRRVLAEHQITQEKRIAEKNQRSMTNTHRKVGKTPRISFRQKEDTQMLKTSTCVKRTKPKPTIVTPRSNTYQMLETNIWAESQMPEGDIWEMVQSYRQMLIFNTFNTENTVNREPDNTDEEQIGV